MAKKFLKCAKCKYAFQIRQSGEIKQITCPYCGKTNQKDTFAELNEEQFGNGYKISIKEFRHVLKDASKYMIRAFFRKISGCFEGWLWVFEPKTGIGGEKVRTKRASF